MKKLFTLLALLTCFLGANAVEKVDFEINFSEYENLWEWGSGWNASANSDYFDLQDGCLHFTLDEAKGNNYDIQLQPFPSVQDLDASYTVTIVLKGAPAGDQNSIWLAFSGSDTPGWCEAPADFQEFTFTDVVNNPNAQYFANSGSILLQCGHFVGEFWIKSIKMSHDEVVQEVEWENILANGDASAAWENPDAQTVNDKYDGEGAEKVSAYSKEYGYNDNNPHAAFIEDGMFVCKTNPVDPPLVWEEDGEQWGQQHSAGDPKPDNTWQNQFWINYPRPLGDGEPVKLSFKYKASEDARVTTQDHYAPGGYQGGGKVGELKFTTDWQTYEGSWDAASGIQSLAFNFGEDGQYEKSITFYFDDLSLQVQKLEEGWFVAGTDPDDGDPAYDFTNAVKFEQEGEDYVATIGGEAEDTWVKEIMISTRRGTDKGFKSATIKVDTESPITNDPEDWHGYEAKGKSTVALPVRGAWKIRIAVGDENLISFEKIYGEEDIEPVEIAVNENELVIKGVERKYTSGEAQNIEDLPDDYVADGQPWDNQFFIKANRPLKAGEITIIEFDYLATTDAKVSVQAHGDPGDYKTNMFDLNFTTEEQPFSQEWEVPEKTPWGSAIQGNIQSMAFNMAEIKEACDYTIKNVKWYLKYPEEGMTTENLIDAESTDNFWVKIGAGTDPYNWTTGPAKKGNPDANNDGKIDIGDVDYVIMNIGEDLTEANAGADANGDGKIDVADADFVIEAIE